MAIASYIPTWNVQRFPFELAGAPPVDERRRPKISVLIISRPTSARWERGALRREFNEAMAFWTSSIDRKPAVCEPVLAGRESAGKRVRLFEGNMPGPWRTVVGAVSNIAQNDVARRSPISWCTCPTGKCRTKGHQRSRASSRPAWNSRKCFSTRVTRWIPTAHVWPFTLADRLLVNYWDRRLYGALFLIFAAIALLLASLGLYSVIAHSVSRRTQEIESGWRLARGTRRSQTHIRARTASCRNWSYDWTGRVAGGQPRPGIRASPGFTLRPHHAGSRLCRVDFGGPARVLIPARHAMRVDPVIALRHD